MHVDPNRPESAHNPSPAAHAARLPVVDVWFGTMAVTQWRSQLSGLSPEERTRAGRFVFDRDRARFVCARDLAVRAGALHR